MKKTPVALLTAGVISLFSLAGPNSADADSRSRQRKLDQEVRRELRRDQAELERDRRDLDRLYRSRASRSEIDRKKAEIRQDMREVREGRERLYGDSYGYNGWYGRGHDNGWWNWGNGWWGNRERDRWRNDYRYD